jgi:broad specificity phosphatase PhoE
VPEPRTLLLLRHGRTAWNAQVRAQGHADVSLDDLGRVQAAAAAPTLAARRPRLLWSSDLARARETAAYVAAATGLVVHHDARLREYDLGERTGLTMAEYAATFPDEHAAFRAGRYEVVPGGESTDQVVARVTEAVCEALAALEPGECAVVVGHGAALKVSVLGLLGWPQDAAGGLQALDNAGWAEVTDSGVDGRLRLTAWNRTAGGVPDFATREGVG